MSIILFCEDCMKSLSFLIICVLFLSANLTFAASYSSELPIVNSSERASSSRISEAKLLESYVLRYKEKLNVLYFQYSQTESIAIKNANEQLLEMASALERIQTRSVSEYDATRVMKNIVEDIKVLNIRMKVYLEQEELILQEKLQTQAQKFNLIGTKISVLLEDFIEKMTSILIKKSSLTSNDTSIIRSLVKIRDENKRIRNFSTVIFSSEEDMKSYFQNIIENIRREMQNIKNLSSK